MKKDITTVLSSTWNLAIVSSSELVVAPLLQLGRCDEATQLLQHPRRERGVLQRPGMGRGKAEVQA